MTNSSAFASSDNEQCPAAVDQMYIKPFYEIPWSSSENIEFEDPGHDPFVDNSDAIKMNHLRGSGKQGKCREKAVWTSLQGMRGQSRAGPAPAANRHLIDFWKDFSNGEVFSLPTLGPGKSDSIQRISVDVAKQVVEGMYNIDYLVIDCRFPYEYRGGHIINAVNISSTKKLGLLFRRPRALIFHCEFSSIRAPRLAQHLRNMDRMKNPYPLLTIPEVYVMEGGYRKFYSRYPDLCDPKGYVTMDNLDYRDLYKRDKLRSNK
ncbi:similarity with M phase inducer phosphatase [Encephalitozoon cuniculi GB-M1]|uniref:M-phase inducer phosphatase n=2 Tax=Encephalitozoon cuniculi TaxID=6035 RepID=Q8SVU9_ENCCU|nr:putative tyrosine protein phosphatase MIH1 [Encephalitozoon cuniculi GB-M1]AGE95277.1 m phase inducer phosphatase [Encephalitozoon cuniculi]KMV66273.1 mitotic phase inducer phosphatase [Encephalitozoon cuniculi EcunIII-L]UYI27448.1 mitotic phase inducer phosphatase [Encephalitozoon cuniculi]CAD25258.1 similarity with M phase inducer phosphatase [Encephalitozoon cuniculi GB-M1]